MFICSQANVIVQLFVEILNRYLYYYECEPQNEAVTVKYLAGLIALINTNMANMDTTDPVSCCSTRNVVI
jgi:vacuolar protein sorting-associated protein 35